MEKIQKMSQQWDKRLHDITKPLSEKEMEELHHYIHEVSFLDSQKALPESVRMVKEFHDLFEHPVGRVIGQEPLNIRQLRIKLLFEELVELAEAGDVQTTMALLCLSHLQKINAKLIMENRATKDIILEVPADGDNVNSVEEADALADLQYVLDGKKLTSGLYIYMDAVFERVHQNNMSKAHRSEDHANETMDKKPEEGPFTKSLRGDLWFLYNKDGKLTKPWDHKKVSIAPLIPGIHHGMQPEGE